MTNQFPGTFPVIADRVGTLYGYVFQAPTDPTVPGAAIAPWTYGVASTGTVAPNRYISRRAAVVALLWRCEVDRPETAAVADLDLMGVLHGLSERFDGHEILQAALDYSCSRLSPLEPVEDDGAAVARRDDPAPLDRALMHRVVSGRVGPWTADDLFALYDKVAPDRTPLVAVPE